MALNEYNATSMFVVKEAYRTIRTNLMFSIVKTGCKTVVFTSSVQGEGKTTTAANVAFSLARSNKKVLLLDIDLRRPRIHKLLKIPGTPGMTDFLSGFRTFEEILHKQVFENLDVVCAGTITPNPSEMVSSGLLAGLLEKLAVSYDFIIIDTPPINVVSDALHIIRGSDGVVLIVRQRYSTHSEFQKAIEQIRFIDGKIVGVVVNDADQVKKKYGKYGKYGKYRYGSYSYYGTGEKAKDQEPPQK